MKRSKTLALVLVVAIMMVGAGYAAWTDNIQVNTTVNTGMLDVHFVDAEQLTLAPYITGIVGYEEDLPADGDGQNDWDIANVTLSNLYPGATANVTLKIQNNSTIPVSMNAITDTRSTNWGPNNDNFAQIGASLRFFNSSGVALPEFNADTSSYANPWSPSQLANAEMPVGGYATLTFMFTASDTIEETEEYTFDASAIFKQFNQ